MAQTFDERNLLEIDFEFGLSTTAHKTMWTCWIEKLGLSDNKANEIYRNHELVRDNGTELEKLNHYAEVAALTLKAEKYSDGVDSILSAILDEPPSFDERVKLNVWRHILKDNEVDNPKEEWQVNRNQQLLAKIAQIGRVLGQQVSVKTTSIECEHITVGDDGAGNGDTKPASKKVIQANSNEYAFSGLLNEPARKDEWFEAIDDMTKDFYSRHGEMPTKAKAWTALYQTPPIGYEITAHEDKNGTYLEMPSATKKLRRDNFYGRWTDYTKKKTE